MKTEPSAEFMRAIVEHVAHPIFVKDRRFRFVVLNRAFTALAGHTHEAMIGKTDYDFFPKEQADFFRQKDIEMFASEGVVQIDEEPISDAEGNLHILATTKVPFRAATGEVTHLIGIIKDITALKRAEAALKDANEQLERRVAERTAELALAQDELVRKERLAVLGQLSGGLAHQLRNPLAAIQNAVAVLRRSDAEATRVTALDIIDEEIRVADRTIRDLLDYAAIRPPVSRSVAVVELIEQALDLEHARDRVAVQVNAAPGQRVEVDPSQTLAALGNVIRNAFDAVELSPQPRIQIDVEERPRSIVITVGDSGQGVPESARESLFDPLVTTKPLGIGLGLSIARSLVTNQGGSIRFSSSPLGGAAFVIELPGSPTTAEDA